MLQDAQTPWPDLIARLFGKNLSLLSRPVDSGTGDSLADLIGKVLTEPVFLFRSVIRMLTLEFWFHFLNKSTGRCGLLLAIRIQTGTKRKSGVTLGVWVIFCREGQSQTLPSTVDIQL